MTNRLKQAFEAASKLPESEQKALAEWLLQALAADKRWSDLLEGSHDKLAQLAADALAEHRARRTGE